MPKLPVFLLALLCCSLQAWADVGFVIDHQDTDITVLSQADLLLAKDSLNIAYGRGSHGSQLSTGMEGLVPFADGGGLGLSFPTGFFAWNNGGTEGALDLHDQGLEGNLDLYPLWVDRTIAYLEDPANMGTNVIIWSWCGGHVTTYRDGTLYSEYLTPMSELEAAYPEVTFVYMTGHVNNGGYYEDTIAANNVIRDYAATNDKVLYDFADIEHYDPDGTLFQFVRDSCDYYESPNGPLLGNWATEWQDSHTQDFDWYDCVSAHSQPLNANRKAYAAWALWTEIARRMAASSATPPVGDRTVRLEPARPNPFNPRTTISFSLARPTHARLAIYDVGGRQITILMDRSLCAGHHRATWSGHDNADREVATGSYLVRLVTEEQVASWRISLVR